MKDVITFLTWWITTFATSFACIVITHCDPDALVMVPLLAGWALFPAAYVREKLEELE